VVEAVTYRRALEYCDEHGYLDGEERGALFDDAETEINAAVASAAIPADPAARRRQREEREQ
jgi:hypothetical protein